MSESGQVVVFGAGEEEYSGEPRVSGGELAGLVAVLLICYALGAVGGMVTGPEIPGWYAGLVNPAWTPPVWVFAPVWGVLCLMIVAPGWLIWRRLGEDGVGGVVGLLGAQLALNCLWSVLFFRMQNPGLAVLEIAALWGAIWVMMFRGRSRWAGALLIPYVLWAGYLAVLNMRILMLSG